MCKVVSSSWSRARASSWLILGGGPASFNLYMRKSSWMRVDFWHLSFAGGSILNHDLVALGFISGVPADKAKAVKQVLKEKVVIYSFEITPCANRQTCRIWWDCVSSSTKPFIFCQYPGNQRILCFPMSKFKGYITQHQKKGRKTPPKKLLI